MFALAAYSLFNFLIDQTQSGTLATQFARLNGLSVSIFAGTVNLFSIFFTREERVGFKLSSRKSAEFIIFASSLIVAVISGFTPLVVSGIEANTFPAKVIYSDFYPVLLGFIFLNLLIALGNLISSYITGEEKAKKQIQTIFIGVIITVLISTFTNLILPLTGDFTLLQFSSISTICFSIALTIAILRFQILNVRFIIGSFIYNLILSFYNFFLIIVSIFLVTVLQGEINILWLGIFVLVILYSHTVLFNKLNHYLKKEINTRFINPGYDPYEVVNELSNSITKELELKTLIQQVISTLTRTIKPEGLVTSIFTENKNPQTFFDKDSFISDRQELKTIEAHAKLLWKVNNYEPILYQELTKYTNHNYEKQVNIIEPLRMVFEKNSIRALIPVMSANELKGMFVLGQKEADSPYTVQDNELLINIANTLGIALSRASLYEEVKEFNNTLQAKIDTATRDLKRQNINMEIALDRMERLRSQEQDMLDVLGHELRTPITIVRNALAVLKMDFQPDKGIESGKLETYINKALESTKREIVLIETLLAATKIDANRVQLNLEKVELLDVINDAIEGQIEVAKERKLELSFEKPVTFEGGDTNWTVYADRTRIQEVVDNFTSNSVKYTFKGSVKISLSRATLPDNLEKYIKLSITDTGIGIPAEDIPKLGRKFFRARQYVTQDSAVSNVVRPGGTGLGLYVSFELVKMMGGKVEITSQVGVGSTFSFLIPEYTGQERKHIDTTFDRDPELERINKERLQRQMDALDEVETKDHQGMTYMAIKDKPLKNPVSQQPTSQIKEYQRLRNANDIMQQINRNRAILSSDAPGDSLD